MQQKIKDHTTVIPRKQTGRNEAHKFSLSRLVPLSRTRNIWRLWIRAEQWFVQFPPSMEFKSSCPLLRDRGIFCILLLEFKKDHEKKTTSNGD